MDCDLNKPNVKRHLKNQRNLNRDWIKQLLNFVSYNSIVVVFFFHSHPLQIHTELFIKDVMPKIISTKNEIKRKMRQESGKILTHCSIVKAGQ